MENKKVIFWNVDTQVDFVEPEGKLYVQGAEKIKPLWQQITDFAKQKNITVVNTADFHYPESAELSDEPDFVNTFPQHCMANTTGAEYVAETQPNNPVVFEWNEDYDSFEAVRKARNIVIRKDAFDVFAGNPFTDNVLQLLSPETVVVYGVTTNVCVNDAVVGLSKRVKRVIVVKDAIKELPNIPLPFDVWKKLGVEMMTFEELAAQL
ncbi:isochorismatase family cysteine hydrolase [Draconibacterium sp. IB214405]|uniref:cysteine hydrolase family protein n=1 Tax=Draconibacterium sp. IB214405 TaxID=3097352 RepID=UPI002A1320A2|nr:isochorismatase family cysteine hydrolase [Draconibacterium sp. IB214405]MDX8341032.1 isochorismatase family cysteine hydrolase [Draconibacterium sp. IB214405]